jgi:hypothetical protein
MISNLRAYSGKLYAGVGSDSGGEIYAYDGSQWTKVNVTGFGVPAQNQYLYDLTVFDSKLYVTSNTGWARGNPPGRVWRYDGEPAWTQVGADNFGGGGTASRSMCATDSALFAGTTSGLVYRTDGSSPWANAGYPDATNHNEARGMATCNGTLYAGCNSNGGGGGSPVVARYDGGTSWTNVTPTYPGFVNGTVRSLLEFNGCLYVGVSSFAYPGGNGALIYRYDGSSWTQVNEAGWGEPNNMGAHSLAVFNNTLYAGIGNRGPNAQFEWYGAQVWRLDTPVVDSITPASCVVGNSVSITELAGANFLGTPRVRLKKGAEAIQATGVKRLSETRLTCTFAVPDGATIGDWDVEVENPDGQVGVKSGAFTVTPTPSYYLAEGTNAWGFCTYITIANPDEAAARARVTWMNPDPPATGKGVITSRIYTLPALSQTTISSSEIIGNVDFSTKVECLTGEPIAVDRTMFWTGQGFSPDQSGYHSSISTSTPSKTWYLPEGSSAWSFETWTLVLNPNPSEAKVTLTYMTADGPVARDKTIPANSRATFSMAGDIGSADASIKVTSDQPVVAERSVYRNDRREGSCSIGATTPSTDFFLAEGATGYDVGFTTYVLVQNPNSAENEVTLTYQTGSGQVKGPSFTMQPNTRRTVRLNDTLPADTDVSTHVHGSRPLIAERAMYWDNGTGQAFHSSIGLDSPHAFFMLPDGQTSSGFETWTLVENPNPSAVKIGILYLPQGGGEPVFYEGEIPANSRKSYNMSDKIASGRASILVFSQDGARPVMVERSMYMNSRGAGTDTIGGYLGR